MWKVVALTATVALTGGFVAGHYLWPVRQNARTVDTQRRGRHQPPPPTTNDDGTPPAAPETWSVERVMQEIRGLAKLQSTAKRFEAANTMIEHIEPADAPQLAPQIAALAQDRAVQQIFLSVLDMWSQFEPEAAFRFAATQRNTNLQMAGIMSTIHAWVEADLDAVIKYVEGLPNGQLRGQLSSVVLQAAAETDPERALKLAKTLPGSNAQAETRMVYSNWAMTDVDAAVKAATGIRDTRERNQAVESVMAEWAQKEPTAALDWVLAHGSEPGTSDIVQQAFTMVGVERPDLAAAYIAKLDDGSSRDGIISQVAMRWAGEDRVAAQKWAMSLDDNDRTLALEGMVNSLSYDDPMAALELAKAIDDPLQRTRSVGNVITSIADRDPDDAWKRVQELEPGKEKDEVVATIVSSLARTNPMAAAEALTDVEDNPSLLRASGDVAREWAAIDPQSALRWLERMPEGEAKTYASSTLAGTWVGNDPEAAAAWADTHASTKTRRDLAVSWAQSDPQSAVEWAMTHSKTDKDGQSTFEETVSAWAALDSRRAAQWAGNLPNGKNRDGALAQISENTLYDDPETAMTYIDQISDTKTREATRGRIYALWTTTDEKKAKRWRSSARLSPGEVSAMDNTTAGPREEPPQANGCVCPPEN